MHFVSRSRCVLALATSIVVAALATTIAGSFLSAPKGTAAVAYPANPFQGRTLFVDPQSPAARDVAALARTEPTTAARLRKIADHAQADWFGDWNPPDRIGADVAARVDAATAAGAYPVLVAYNIPQRDCTTGHSAGGATTAESYRAWIGAFRSGIGTRAAAVILEPDALGQIGCLSVLDQRARLDLLRYATQTLARGGNVAVYIDAGHSGWVPPAQMARLLVDAGIVHARGFSLNVSAFGYSADEIAYGYKIAPLVGWKRLVLDTSRNGLGPAVGVADPWCNPPGRALGSPPTTSTGDRLVDAVLWIKRPGESDGTCRGGPPAGTWWRDYALGLADRAAW